MASRLIRKMFDLYQVFDFVFLKSGNGKIDSVQDMKKDMTRKEHDNCDLGAITDLIELEAYRVINKQRNSIYFFELDGRQELLILN